MQTLFATGYIVDLIAGLVGLEALVLLAFKAANGRAIPARHWLPMLLAGLFLLLALRTALIGSSWQVVALWLLAALIAHLIDLWQRVQQHRDATPPASLVSSLLPMLRLPSRRSVR